MERRKRFLMIVVGIAGIGNLLLVLKKIFLAWDCFFIDEYYFVYSKFIGSICFYGDSEYTIRIELWKLILSFIFSIVSLVLTIWLGKTINLKNEFSDYVYSRTNTYMALINLVMSILFLGFLVWFLRLYNYDFIVRLRIL